MYYYLYKISCLIPDKPYYYIGIHKTKNLNDGYFGSGIKLLACIKGLGRKNFKKEILQFCSNYTELLKLEKEIVGTLYETDPWCLNLMEGGQSGIMSEEAKKKISEKAKLRPHPPLTEEHKRKISEGNRGKIIPLEVRRKLSESKKGKPQPKRGPMSEEHKRKLSESKKKNFKGFTEEHRKKISEKKRQRDIEVGMSEETRQKISKALTGRVITPEWRKRMSEAAKKRPYHALTEEHKKHISESLMNHVSLNKGRHIEQPRGVCPYCGLEASLGNLKRWHGENCRMK